MNLRPKEVMALLTLCPKLWTCGSGYDAERLVQVGLAEMRIREVRFFNRPEQQREFRLTAAGIRVLKATVAAARKAARTELQTVGSPAPDSVHGESR